DLMPPRGQAHPCAPVTVLCREQWRRNRRVDKTPAGDAGLIGQESEGFPVERGAAIGAEIAVVPRLSRLGVDAEFAALRHDRAVGEVHRPAEGAARALLAARAVADPVEAGLAVHCDRGLAATAGGGARHAIAFFRFSSTLSRKPSVVS